MKPGIAWVAAALAGAAMACGGNKLQTVVGCAKSSDCGDPTLFSCDASNGVCHCVSNAACSSGQICNPAGFCQAQVTCFVNSDCPPSEMCDFHSNQCVPIGECTADDECAIGTLCQMDAGVCKPGCHDSGDCTLGDACLCVGPDGGPADCVCPAIDEDDRDACTIGQCSTAYCADNLGCPYGEICGVEDGRGGPAICYSNYNSSTRPYCDACTVTPGQNNTCGQGANFCIYDTDESAYGTTYCGADCSQGQACPDGYGCSPIVVVRSIGCSVDSDCPINSTVCTTTDGGCPLDGLCQISAGAKSGFCSGRCYKHEGAAQGFCTCTLDSECDQDECDTSSRTCSITQEPCNPDVSGGGCSAITCVPFHGYGGCRIGENCAPLSGLSCADVRPPNAP